MDPLGTDYWDGLNEYVRYFDRAGYQITMRQWTELRQIEGYIVVQKTKVRHLEVSTVWLGLDHSFLTGPPLFFETMIFNHAYINEFCGYDTYGDFCERYSTEQQARDGHAAAVVMLTAALDAAGLDEEAAHEPAEGE